MAEVACGGTCGGEVLALAGVGVGVGVVGVWASSPPFGREWLMWWFC